jgi:cellulose biosynthesis protein BcsQ
LVHYVERTCVDPHGQTLKFAKEISRSVVIQEAQRVGQSILQYKGDHHVADEYRALAREMEERLAALRQPQVVAAAEVVHA